MPSDEQPPSFQFYPRDYMADPDVQSLTWEQRGRYHWALCCSSLSASPGIAPESDWRRWMGYSDTEWAEVREAHARCFRMTGDGAWIQERMRVSRGEQKARFKQAKEAGRLSGVARRRYALNRIRTDVEQNANGMATQEQFNVARTPASASASASAFQEDSKPNTLGQTKSNGHANGHDPDDLPVPVWFDRVFWPEYPRKVKRPAAKRALIAVFKATPKSKHDALGDAIMDGLDKYCKAVSDKDMEFVSHPATWIHNRRWEDES